ncbi:tetratricopeptide repeat protein [Thalassotalea ponticola]|uniref:tetratricopeptide repeat protein n=1 Tax=Thalassotalea ponticola TaxID=1523392 RepID=UPI0025B4B8F7|nr:tetratricopeptide repeat protein [Thalassotalea ponticola]MDN3651474.1 tetratricopeptide repeat protein [Thalassotalea ponticola]
MRERMVYIAAVVLFTLTLTGCSTTKQTLSQADINNLLVDHAFEGYNTVFVESENDIYSLDQAMIDFVHGSIMMEEDAFARSQMLLKKLFYSSPTELRYLNGANLTARQAFHQNTANCLSLTILAYALAKEAQLDIQFQEIDIPEYWVRSGDYNLLTGHVNLKVIGDSHNNYRVVWGGKTTTIDFDPYVVKQHFAKNVISRKRVTAMFYNNKGAQYLVQGDHKSAYAYFKAAITHDPSFSAVWGNIGLLYKQVGLTDRAEQAYLAAVVLDDANLNAWTNLAILLSQEGRVTEAADIHRFIDKSRQSNPYYFALLGDEAYHQGDYEQSIYYYKKADNMLEQQHEFYFGLSRSYYQLGDMTRAERYLAKAKQAANFDDIKRRYQSKLNLLTRLP